MLELLPTRGADPDRELDRLWNDLVSGSEDRGDYTLDPASIATVRLFQTLASAPSSAASRKALDRTVLAAIERNAWSWPAQPSVDDSPPPDAIDHSPQRFKRGRNEISARTASPTSRDAVPSVQVLPASSRTIDSRRWRSARSAGRHIAAALLVVLVGGVSLAGAFYAHLPHSIQPVSLLAPAASTTALPSGVSVHTLLDVTMSDFEANAAYALCERYQFPPGTTLRAEVHDGGLPDVFYVVDGEVDVRLDEGAMSGRVIRNGGQAAEESLPVGKAVTVHAGDAVLIPEQSTADLMNISGEGAQLLLLLLPITADGPHTNAILQDEGNGRALDVRPPLRLTLDIAHLAPDASLPGVSSGNSERVVNPVDHDRVMDARVSGNGAVMNAGDSPLDAYILTLTSASGS